MSIFFSLNLVSYILNWVLSDSYVRVTPDKSTKHFNIASFDILTLSLKH